MQDFEATHSIPPAEDIPITQVPIRWVGSTHLHEHRFPKGWWRNSLTTQFACTSDRSTACCFAEHTSPSDPAIAIAEVHASPDPRGRVAAPAVDDASLVVIVV
jgi:hypothetical protein